MSSFSNSANSKKVTATPGGGGVVGGGGSSVGSGARDSPSFQQSPRTSNMHSMFRLPVASFTAKPKSNPIAALSNNINQTASAAAAAAAAANQRAKNRHTVSNVDDYDSSSYHKSDSPPLNEHGQAINSSKFKYDAENSSPPLSKTPDSAADCRNWISYSEMSAGSGGGHAGSGTGGAGGCQGNNSNYNDSDHEMLESSATGLSGSGSGGLDDDSVDGELDSTSQVMASPLFDQSQYVNEDVDDHTTKRLKTFIVTTLHSEQIYLMKISKLLSFKTYLEDHFDGAQADISVLFSNIQKIYTTHDVIVAKLKECLRSLSDLLSTFTSTSSTSTSSSSLASATNQRQPNSSTSPSHQSTSTSTNNAANDRNNAKMKELFLSNAVQLLANIMDISFQIYLEFLKNYSKSMTILNKLESTPTADPSSPKRKSFVECQQDFIKQLKENVSSSKNSSASSDPSSAASKNANDPYNIYYNDSDKNAFNTAKIFAEEILRRPTKLFEFILSLKEECSIAANELPKSSSESLQKRIRSLFENESLKSLREEVFDQINRNIMPKEVRKHEDVVELSENNKDRKLRHLILFGDCLVCCRLKKDKRQLKWFIPIDKLEIFLDEYTSAKSENELRHMREEVVNLRGNLLQSDEKSSSRLQKIKKKLAEQENEITIQSSNLKLIVRHNPSLSSSSSNSNSTLSTSSGSLGGFSNLSNLSIFGSNGALGSSSTNLSSFSHSHHSHHHHQSALYHSYNQSSTSSFYSTNSSFHSHSSPNSVNSNSYYNSSSSTGAYSGNSQFVFLFTSDFERIAWLEEINGAIYALKFRKTAINISQSDIESRITSLKKQEEPPKAITSSCTGSLELLIKHIEELSQPNKVFVAVELKSCGSYLQVAQTNCTELTTTPSWNEKFNLELQCVDSLRIILYSQTSGKALAIASQELEIDTNINYNKIVVARLNNGISLHIAMKFLWPKKTITRRRTRNRNDIFGGNLVELLQREKSTIPRILKDCVEVIETKGIQEVGIYRVSSVVSEVQKMKELYSKNPNLALSEMRQKSPHLAANLLKLYLRELPDPLFTSQLYKRFMDALSQPCHEFRAGVLCGIFNDLPEANKTTIIFILNHLLNIANHSDKNMMSLQNLCTLFGPTLMKLSPKDNLQADDMAREIKESMQQAQVLFYILQMHSEERLVIDASMAQDQDQPQQQSSSNRTDNPIESGFSRLNLKNMFNNNQPSSSLSSSDAAVAASTPTSSSSNLQNRIDNNNNTLNKTNILTKNSDERYPKSNMQTAL